MRQVGPTSAVAQLRLPDNMDEFEAQVGVDP